MRHKGLDLCPQVHVAARRRLHERICDFLLKLICHAAADGTRLDAQVGLALLEKTTTTSVAILPCEYYNWSLSSVSMARASLFEAGSTPQTATGSQEWRGNLVNELTRGAKYQYESIVKMVGDICQDLERRCDEAEHPLRTEQMKNQDLTIELEISQAKLAELESQVLERTQLSDGLEAERNCLQDQVQAFEQRLQILSSRLTNLQQESCEAEQEAKNAAEAAREAAKQQELTYLASMTGKDDMLEEQGAQLADLKDHISSMQNELAHLRFKEINTEEDTRSLEGTLNERNEVIEQVKAAIATKEADMDRLIRLEASLKHENQKLKTEVCDLPICWPGTPCLPIIGSRNA